MDLDQLALLAQGAAARADASQTSEADEALAAALERAGKYLSYRPRTERQVRDELRDLDYEQSTIEAAVVRLTELRLIDDGDFARRWIEERARTKGKAPDVLVSELRARGVSRETAEEALAESGLDEDTQATEVASRLARKVLRFPLAEQGPRLYELMRRRGFSHEHAEAGARAVLPPEGWD
ncbi:MAG: regulatory protein RecX [Actinomycetota bacterium]